MAKRIGKIFWPIVFIGIIVDQLTKYIVNSNLVIGESYPVLNNIFHITHVFNTGAGFGIMKNQTKFFIFVALLVIFFIFYYYKEIKTKEVAISVAFVLSGTVGNLIDRVRFGYVIDFIDFRIWPTFNIADSLVVLGAIGLIWYLKD